MKKFLIFALLVSGCAEKPPKDFTPAPGYGAVPAAETDPQPTPTPIPPPKKKRANETLKGILHGVGKGLEAVGRAKTGKKEVHCTSRREGDTVYTDCQEQ